MKKIYLLICFTFLGLTSCSKKEDEAQVIIDPVATTYLPSKIMKGVIPKLFSYNGNKIIKITDSGLSREEYTYNSNDLISSKMQYDISGNLRETVSYFYINGILSNYKTDLRTAFATEDCVLTYNADKTISYTINLIVKLIPTNISLIETGKYTFLNGNLVKVETKVDQTASGGDLVETVDTYEYDSKNNLTKNILGLNKIYSEIGNMSVNNIVKKSSSVRTLSGTTETLVSNVKIRNEYLYNIDNFPTEKRQYNPTLLGLTFQYFY